MGDVPGYWMNETIGVLRPAVEAYLRGEPMTDAQLGAMRAYLRQWMAAPAWRGQAIGPLRRRIDGIGSRAELETWFDDAEGEGIDPL